MSYKSSADSHNKALRLYRDIDKTYQKLETGNIKIFEYKVENAIDKVYELKKLTNKINLNDLSDKLTLEKVEKVKKNISFFRHFSYFMERELHKIYFSEKLKEPIQNYITNLNIDKYELANYGSYDQLGKEFISAMTQRDRVLDYKNEIMRIVKGKMSQKEFNKIFSVLRRYIKKDFIPKYKSKSPSYIGHNNYLRDIEKDTQKVPSEIEKQSGVWKHSKKGDIKFIRKDGEREETERQGGTTTSTPPKKEFEDEEAQKYIELKDGTQIPYDRKHIGSGITTYEDEKGNEVYSYIHLSEGFVSVDKYLKLTNS